MARARGANATMAGAFESVYGTPPASGYKKLPFASSNLGEEQNLITSELLGYGRDALAPTRDVINNDGDVVVPVDLRNFGTWLKLMFGAPTTTAATGVYTHEFHSGAVNLPSMSIQIGMPEVPSYGMNFGVRGNTMRIVMARSGLLTATMGLIAQGETKATTSGAGSPTEAVLERFSHFQGGVTREGVDLGHVVSAEFTYSNGLDKVEVIRSDGRIEDADPGMAMMSGNIVVRFADTVLMDQATSGDPCELTFGWAPDEDKSLIFTAHSVFLPRAKTPVTGPGGIQATFAWQAAKDPTVGRAVTAVLVNDVASY